MTISKKELFKWKPFTYICEGFNGEKEEIGGFFPADVREHCPFTIKQISGPIVTGFSSWLMYQVVN